MAVNKKVVSIDTEQAQTSVKDLRLQLKALKDQMLSTEQGTEEYNEALRQAAEITHTLKEQTEFINATAMDAGQIISNTTNAIGTFTGGLQAAKAVLNLFGVENEAVLKSLQQMQNLMAITQALPAIDAGMKAIKKLGIALQGAAASAGALKTALVATGIGALAAAVGLLAANWDKVTAALQKYGYVSKKQLEEDAKRIDELRGKVADLKGKYEEWVKNDKISKLNAKSKKSYDDLTKAIEGYQIQLDEVVATQQLPENKNSRENWERLQAEGQKYQDNIKLLKDQQDAILANKNSYIEVDKSAQAAAEAEKKAREALIESLKKSYTILNDEIRQYGMSDEEKELDNLATQESKRLAVIEEARKNEIITEQEAEEQKLAVTEEYSRLAAEVEKKYRDEAQKEELQKRDELLKFVQSLQDSFKTSDEVYAEEQAKLKEAYDNDLLSQEEYNRLSELLAKEHAEKQKQLAWAAVGAWTSALSSFGQVFSSFAEIIDRSTEEGEKKYRAMMYVSTMISMLAGVMNAVSSAFSPANSWMTLPGQIIMAAATSASVLATGIAQMVAIKNASSKGGGASMGASPSTGALQSLVAPVQYTQDVQGASIEGAIKDTKVYVTESDITDTQRRVSVTEGEARF